MNVKQVGWATRAAFLVAGWQFHVAWLVAAPAALAQSSDSGFVNLFDGASLAGWTQRNGTATYRIEEGEIVGTTSEGSPNSFLCSDQLYGDFDLRFEVKVDSRLNSGVQIRSQCAGDTPEGRVNGPQVEIATEGTAGYIYGEAAGGWMTPDADRVPHQHFRDGDWNTYRVRAVGPRIQVWLNGNQVSDLIHDERFASHPRGFIGLQVHSIGAGEGPYEVRWRNLKLLDLTGFVSLFNENDLAGWVTTGNWLPQADGTLLIEPRPGEAGWERYSAYLWSERKWSDFVWTLEYSYPAGGNSGVYFRVADRADPVKQGIEAQILDSSGHTGEMTHHDHGGIIATQGPAKNMSLPPGEWNQMVITCRGSHLQVELNGEDIIDLQLDEGPMKDRPREGFIGLQDHGEPNNLRFRHLMIRELEAEADVDPEKGSDPGEREPVDFARDVQPILMAQCHGCHGPDLQESGYRLDLKAAALGVGDFGETPIVSGAAGRSPLLEYVSQPDAAIVMPPADKGRRLRPDEVDVLRRWIDEGAHWPEELSGEHGPRLTTSHWSFQAVKQVEPPSTRGGAVPAEALHNAIDQFVVQRLLEEGLGPSAPADRVTLIRRIYLDVHGLLPTPEQIAAFVDDVAPDAWAKVVDEVLASPHYGERWARHWLDIVRFGESTGFEVNRDRNNAWYYRDYVIGALNEDMPYDQFVREQLAGDQLGADEATGFLVGGPHDLVTSPDINLTLMQRQDELADYVNTTSTTFLGLTVACARCHNHKFDPILQKDYYALQAVFAGTGHGERKLAARAPPEVLDQLPKVRSRLAECEARLNELAAAAPSREAAGASLRPAVNARSNEETFGPVTARFVRFVSRRTNQAETCLDELEVFALDGRNVALAAGGTRVSSSGDYSGNPIHQLAHIHDGLGGNDHSWIADTADECWVQLELPGPEMIGRIVWARDRQGVFADRLPVDYALLVSDDGKAWTEVAGSGDRQPFLVNGVEPEGSFIARLSGDEATAAQTLLNETRELRAQAKELEDRIPTAYIGTFRAAEEVRRLYRGEPLQPREKVAPDTLTVFGTLGMDSTADEATRRLQLAEWIASEENPLTARVIVNRVWQYHFGEGIVATPSDFGVNGVPPAHPELLDWLAGEFMRNGWSLKWLHREILLSATWRQSSAPRAEALARDADCRLLWRFPPRRLEAEAIRDCVLQASGKLNRQAGGPGFLLFRVDRENVHHYFPLEEFGTEHFRRMIYMTKIRQELEDVFGVFDCPDGGQTIPNRSRSTTPLQALNLLNSQFMVGQAGFLAERLRLKGGEETAAQVRLAFEWLLLREPRDRELVEACELVAGHGLEAFCRAMLNANEFLFLS